MKPTCIECGESCDTEKKVVEHIHRKHGHHSCQNTWMMKNNVNCHSRKIMPLDPTLEFTPCINEQKNNTTPHWVWRRDNDTHCLKCFHDDKIGSGCDCHHCRAMGISDFNRMMR